MLSRRRRRAAASSFYLAENDRGSCTVSYVDMCMAQVDAALAHLHLMDLYHNDVRTDNTMLKDDDTAVLVDFDSCLPKDATLLKGNIAGGHITKNKSGPENDLFGRNKVKEELRKAFPKTIADPLEESPTGRHGASG